MSAEILRRAAALMRKRAKAATPGPWEQTGVLGAEWDDIVDSEASNGIVADTDTSEENAEHIASWHPAVALAVADWLEHVAQAAEKDAADGWQMGARYPGLAVARAYLGEPA